jgi:hypothetical protein
MTFTIESLRYFNDVLCLVRRSHESPVQDEQASRHAFRGLVFCTRKLEQGLRMLDEHPVRLERCDVVTS